MQDFGKRLAAILEVTGVSQSDLARRVGVKQATVSRWLPPRNSIPSGEVLARIYAEFPSLMPLGRRE